MTFQVILQKLYASHEFCPVYQSWEEVKGAATSIPRNGRLRAVAGHFGYGLHLDDDIKPLIESEARYITVLRDPVHRVVSNFNHVVNSDLPAHREILAMHPTLESFLKFPWARDLQTFFVSGWAYDDVASKPAEAARATIELLRDRYEVVGLTERFDESLILFADAFGWELPTYASVNRASDQSPLIRVEDLPPSLIDRIKEANPCDMAIYEYAKSLFDAQCAATPSFQAKLGDYRSRLAGGRPESGREVDRRDVPEPSLSS